MTSKDYYQKIYEDQSLHYGDSSRNRCPGTRYLPLYKDWLKSPVFDYGCGRGDTVELIRYNQLIAIGMDWISLNNDMLVGDITVPADQQSERIADAMRCARSAICIDVFEHIDDEGLTGLISNLKLARNIVITIHTGLMAKIYGQQPHINIKPVREWSLFLKNHGLKIDTIEKLEADRWLYKLTS